MRLHSILYTVFTKPIQIKQILHKRKTQMNNIFYIVGVIVVVIVILSFLGLR